MLLCAKSRSPFRLRQHKRKKWNYHPFSLHTRQTDILFAVVAAKLLTTWLRIILLPPFLLTDIHDPPCNFLLFFFTAAHIAIVNALFPNVKQILKIPKNLICSHLFPDTSLLIEIVQGHAHRRHNPRNRIAGYDLLQCPVRNNQCNPHDTQQADADQGQKRCHEHVSLRT